MPGSPRFDAQETNQPPTRPLHPAALLLVLGILGAGLALGRHWAPLGIAALVLGILALRAEGRALRAELPILMLALVVFLAHVLFAGPAWRSTLPKAAEIACRLLALLYLIRWAARTFLGRAARWLMGLRPPRRPRAALLLLESARLTAALLPLALREGEQHVLALRARGIRPGRGASGRGRYLLAWLLPFLGTMLRIGDAYADALLARGYVLGRERRVGLRLRWGVAELLALAAGGAAAFSVRGV